jgi:hypothetical protein
MASIAGALPALCCVWEAQALVRALDIAGTAVLAGVVLAGINVCTQTDTSMYIQRRVVQPAVKSICAVNRWQQTPLLLQAVSMQACCTQTDTCTLMSDPMKQVLVLSRFACLFSRHLP